MEKSKFIRGLHSDIQLTDKDCRRIIRNCVNSRPWKLTCTMEMEELAELTQQISKQIRGYGDRTGLLEEMADVALGMEYLKVIFDISQEEMQKAIDVKLQRERNRQR